MSQRKKAPLLQGSLDMLILQTLKSGAKHGYTISRHIRDASQNYLQVEEGSLYPALHRMEQQGWITSFWGASESNRRAKFYELSADGRKQLRRETEQWNHMAQAIGSVLSYQS